MLPLILAMMLPVTFVPVNTTGPVLFDGEAIAYVHLNGTQAAVELPLLPGNHTVKTPGQSLNVSFFDVSCSTEGDFTCNFTGRSNISMRFQMSCGRTRVGKLLLNDGERETISAGGNCDTALLKVGDYRHEFAFTRTFTNYLTFDGERNVTVWQDGHVILEKFARDYVGFPELDPGEYRVSTGEVKGKLIIKPVESRLYGYSMAALLVFATLALLWKG